MASQLPNHIASIGFYAAASLCITLAVAILYVLGVVSSLWIFYIKESVMKAKDRPPIGGTAFHQLVYFDRLFDYHVALALRHRTSRLLKPGSSDVMTAEPANIEHVLKTSFSKYSKGDYNTRIMKDLFGDGLFAADGEKWRQQRKLASHEFSTKVLRDFSSNVFRKNAAKLAEKISLAAADGITLDMQDLLMKTTMDSIFKVGFGSDLDTLSGSDELGTRFSKAFDEANWIVYHRYIDLFWGIKRFLDIGSEARLKRNIKIIDDFVIQLIRRKRLQMKNGQEYKGKEDILSRFIIASEKDPVAMNDKYLRDIVLNFLIAGKDSTAITLSWFFYMLCKNPVVQEKIALEIKETVEPVIDNGSMENFTARLTEAATDKMQYLHAAITETLRLYPVVPVDAKTAEEEDVLPDGYKVTKGDTVNYMIYAMGRMKYLWGEDAEEFRPERWLANGVFRPESPYKFVAFNAGPRICLGKEFAYRQMKILAAALIHFFRFKLEEESKDLGYKTMFTLHVDQGLHLFAYSRPR